jgi:hypothetical protein
MLMLPQEKTYQNDYSEYLIEILITWLWFSDYNFVFRYLFISMIIYDLLLHVHGLLYLTLMLDVWAA